MAFTSVQELWSYLPLFMICAGMAVYIFTTCICCCRTTPPSSSSKECDYYYYNNTPSVSTSTPTSTYTSWVSWTTVWVIVIAATLLFYKWIDNEIRSHYRICKQLEEVEYGESESLWFKYCSEPGAPPSRILTPHCIDAHQVITYTANDFQHNITECVISAIAKHFHFHVLPEMNGLSAYVLISFTETFRSLFFVFGIAVLCIGMGVGVCLCRRQTIVTAKNTLPQLPMPASLSETLRMIQKQ